MLVNPYLDLTHEFNRVAAGNEQVVGRLLERRPLLEHARSGDRDALAVALDAGR